MAHNSIILALLLFTTFFTQAQSEIVITHIEETINPVAGIELSNISYPLLRINLANDALKERYPTSEIILVRLDRAVYQARFHGSSTGEKNSLKSVLSKAREGDKILLKLRAKNSDDPDKTITIPLK